MYYRQSFELCGIKMGLPQNIKDKANELAQDNKQDELVEYFKEVLKTNKATFEDVLSYARRNHFIEEKTKRYALNPVSINKLGILKENELAAQFYYLAAERANPSGCRNYARRAIEGRGIEQSIETAISYSIKALELGESDSALCKSVFDLWIKHIKTLTTLLKENTDAVKNFYKIIKKINDSKTLNDASIQICFLSGQLLEILDKPKKAWNAYISVDDHSHTLYPEIIQARKNLVTQVINQMFSKHIVDLGLRGTKSKQSEVLNDDIELRSENSEEEKLIKKLKLSTNYAVFWQKDSDDFHSVNVNKYDKQHQSNQRILDDKEEELNSLLYESTEDKEKKTLRHQRTLIQEIQSKDGERYTRLNIDRRASMRSHKAESRFFDPWHFNKIETLESIKNLVLKIVDQRFSFTPNETALSLQGISSRTLICAERVFQEALRFLGVTGKQLGIPIVRKTSWDFGYISGFNKFGPIERYQIGNTEIQVEHRTDAKPDRLGDCFLKQLGSYKSDIYPFFQKITAGDSAKERLIAQLLIQFSKEHQPVTLAELQEIYPQSTISDIDKFNQIAFLTKEKEQAQWHSASNQRLLIGMSTAQAKALILVKEGWLTLADLFTGSDFSVYSHAKLIDAPNTLLESCKQIESLYAEFMFRSYAPEVATFFKKNILSKEDRTVVLTRQQARKALQIVYGGEADSDGEGYDSDLEFS